MDPQSWPSFPTPASRRWGLAESPLDRRHRMASVRIDTAGAAAGGYTIVIPYLERTVAADVVRRLYAEAGERAFRW